MKHKIIYTLLFSLMFLGSMNAQLECASSLDVTLDEDGLGEIQAIDLVPNIEFYLANGTVTYFIVPFHSGVITSGDDIITVGCNTIWHGTFLVEYTENGDLIESCSGNLNIMDPMNGCPNYSFCEDLNIDCKRAVDGFSFYSASLYDIPAENFAVCSESLDCPGTYEVAIGHITNAANLTYGPFIDADDVVDYLTPIVLAYTENGVTEYDNSTLYVWQNLECFLIPKSSRTIDMDITQEATIYPTMFLGSANTCTDVTLAVTEINGDIPSDFFDSATLDCDDLGYHTVYLRDALTGMISSCQLFLADPLEACGPVLGPGDKLISMSNNPPVGTYANTNISVNGIDLQSSPTGKGWIINEDFLADGTNTLNFDSGPFILNGISTFDLVLLMRLIIFDEYNSPMISVAMDIDGSGYNGIGDLVMIRSLILGLPSTMDSPNVLFKPKEFQFPANFNPFDFEYDFTKYDFEKADFDDLSFKFEAYKVGDMNGSAVVEDSLMANAPSQTRDLEVFEVPDMEITANVPFNFSLTYKGEEGFKGLLAALVSNGITFQVLTSEHGSEVDYNVLNSNEIRISYVSTNPNEPIDEISFDITAISSQSGELIDFLALKSGFPHEVINENDETIKINDIEAETSTSVVEILPVPQMSIFPNPTSQKLTISVESGKLGRVEILDPMGQKIMIGKSDTNTLQLDVTTLAKGLYFISSGLNDTYTKKSFIKI